jgi:hypothetical protein
LNISSKCDQALYAIVLHAVKCKTPYTIVEERVIPPAIEISSVMFMFDKKIASQINYLL